MNDGRGIINYDGHGMEYGWIWYTIPYQYFTNDHVDMLTNDNMLPFIFDVACKNGKFDYEQDKDALYPECFAEAWMRATHNGEPTGAIGIYASYIAQSWDPPMCAQDESVDLFVNNSYYSFGALCFAGSCQMMVEYPLQEEFYDLGDGVDMFNTWHIFGDPSLRVGGAGPTSKFYINNCLDEAVARFDNVGNLILAGTLEENSTHSATAHDEFRIQDSNGADVAIIDAVDEVMYIDGEKYEGQEELSPPTNSFIIKNKNGDAVAYIDVSGDLYLKGKLYDEWSP